MNVHPKACWACDEQADLIRCDVYWLFPCFSRLMFLILVEVYFSLLRPWWGLSGLFCRHCACVAYTDTARSERWEPVTGQTGQLSNHTLQGPVENEGLTGCIPFLKPGETSDWGTAKPTFAASTYIFGHSGMSLPAPWMMLKSSFWSFVISKGAAWSIFFLVPFQSDEVPVFDASQMAFLTVKLHLLRILMHQPGVRGLCWVKLTGNWFGSRASSSFIFLNASSCSPEVTCFF